MRMLLNILTSIACYNMIASSKQIQECNNLATIHKAKLKGAYECFKSLKFAFLMAA